MPVAIDSKPLLGGGGEIEPRAASMLDAGEDVSGLDSGRRNSSPRRSSAYSVAMERGEVDSWTRFIQAYCKFLGRWKVLVMIFWLLLVAVGGFFTPQFLGNTTNEFEAPPGSPSDLAENLQQDLFCPCDPCPCPDDPDDDGGGGHHHHRRLAEQWKDTRRRLQRGPPPPPGNHPHHHQGNHSGDNDEMQSVIIVHNSSAPPADGSIPSIMDEDGKSTVFRKFLQAMNKSFEDANGKGSVGSMQTYLGMPAEMRSQFLAKDHSAALLMFSIDFDKMNWNDHGGPGRDEDGLHRRLAQALSDAAQTAGGVHAAVTRGRRLQGGGGPDGGLDDAIQDAEDACPGSGLKAYEVGMDGAISTIFRLIFD